MSLPVTVPNTFANSTVSIPLSNLDNNFTTITNSINGLTNGSSQINVASIYATGTANSTTFLRGDGSWANVAAGGGSGTVTSVNAASANGFSFTGGPVTTSGTLTLNVPDPGTSGNVLTSNGASWLSSAGAYPLTSGTPVSSTSGTSITFTGIPSWVKRVTVNISNVSTNGTSSLRFRIGPVAGVETSGYLGTSVGYAGTLLSCVQFTAGFDLNDGGTAAAARNGSFVFSLLDAATNTWSMFGNQGQSNTNAASLIGGSKALAGPLSVLSMTTINGTDTFDAGSINILYE